jgi:hypothetical protein
MVSPLKAEFEHVQLSARLRLAGAAVKNFFERVQKIADCRLPIADLSNWQLAIGNW